MNYQQEFNVRFAQFLDEAVPALRFARVAEKSDGVHFFEATFRNDEMALTCSVEQGCWPSIALKMHRGTHWFQLPLALQALTGKKIEAMDVPLLTQSFIEEYLRLTKSLDTALFNQSYLNIYSQVLHGWRPW